MGRCSRPASKGRSDARLVNASTRGAERDTYRAAPDNDDTSTRARPADRSCGARGGGRPGFASNGAAPRTWRRSRPRIARHLRLEAASDHRLEQPAVRRVLIEDVFHDVAANPSRRHRPLGAHGASASRPVDRRPAGRTRGVAPRGRRSWRSQLRHRGMGYSSATYPHRADTRLCRETKRSLPRAAWASRRSRPPQGSSCGAPVPRKATPSGAQRPSCPDRLRTLRRN